MEVSLYDSPGHDPSLADLCDGNIYFLNWMWYQGKKGAVTPRFYGPNLWCARCTRIEYEKGPYDHKGLDGIVECGASGEACLEIVHIETD